MAVYIFTLMSGYVFSGVDGAQGYRARMLADAPYPVRYIFTEPPTRRDLAFYGRAGIRTGQMLGMHQYFTDHPALELSGKAEEKLEELSANLRATAVERKEHEIRLIRDGAIIAAIQLDGEQKGFYHSIHYYNQAKLVRTEVYTDGVAYVNYFVTAVSGQGMYAKLVRRTFYNRDGSAACDQIFEGEKEWYLFPDGRRYTKQQLLTAFIRKLELKEQDVILLDRPARFDFLQPIFSSKGKARLIVIMHSGHYYEKGEDPYDLYLNKEYDYCFRYSEQIDTMVVSTQEQKRELAEKLLEYRRSVPNIAVIPAGGIECLRRPEGKRRPCSLISVSRIDKRKRIDWLIKSVVKAHQVNPDIFIDIYGRDDGHLGELKKLVSQNRAESYIHFMGWADMTEVYKNYQVYITSSLWETLGLSLMEAVASGTAMIGLDVKYGNRLFIRSGENGYRVDFHRDYVDGNDEELTDAIAETILELFADEKRLEEYHQKSYEIAKEFSMDVIKEKWKDLLEKRLTADPIF